MSRDICNFNFTTMYDAGMIFLGPQHSIYLSMVVQITMTIIIMLVGWARVILLQFSLIVITFMEQIR